MSALILSIGELLWDLLPDRTLLGGAPSNLAYRLVELGNDCRIISRVGQDELGDRALASVKAQGLHTDFIQRDPQHKTGTVDVSFDKEMNPDYVINAPAAYDFIESSPALLEAAGRCSYLVYGTLAQRNPVTRQTLARLMDAAPEATRFLDVNLRKDCYTPEVLESSLWSSHVLKTNHHEIRDICRILDLKGVASLDDLPGMAQSVLHSFGLRTIVVTMEEYGAFLCDSRQGNHYLPGYRVKLEDPLGAGDAFSAAFIHHSLSGAPLKQACKQGNILGAAVATTRGATQPVDQAYINKAVREDRQHIDERLRDHI